MNSAALRSQYLNDAVLSAGPATLVTMLYDRLALDLSRAEKAQRAGDRAEATTQIRHAEDIVTELLTTLRLDTWDGATSLASIYAYLLSELITAGTTHDPEKTAACREVIEPIRMAWHEAVQEIDRATAPQERPAVVAGGLGELGVG